MNLHDSGLLLSCWIRRESEWVSKENKLLALKLPNMGREGANHVGKGGLDCDLDLFARLQRCREFDLVVLKIANGRNHIEDTLKREGKEEGDIRKN